MEMACQGGPEEHSGCRKWLGVIAPTATAASIMAPQMKGDTELSGSIIMLTTLFSVFSSTITLFVLQALKL